MTRTKVTTYSDTNPKPSPEPEPEAYGYIDTTSEADQTLVLTYDTAKASHTGTTIYENIPTAATKKTD